MTETHEGGCFCGAVRYRSSGKPNRVSACSCRWCQGRTGSALGISVYFPEEQVEFIERATRKFRLTSDAGRWIETEFCEHCGTTVTWTLEFLPGERGIAGGTFDEPTFWYKLQRYVFARTKPKLAVYTHILLFGDATSDDLIPATRPSYDGPLVVGADLMQFEIGDEVTINQFSREPAES